jgi:hypothetical protein
MAMVSHPRTRRLLSKALATKIMPAFNDHH